MRILLVATILCLSGCSSTKSFDCPMSGGVNCQSLSSVDAMVDARSSGKSVSYKLYPKRTQEKIVRVWVAPYSEGDVYHEPSYKRVVVQGSGWE